MEREKSQKRKREDDEIIKESKKQEYCVNKPRAYDGVDGVFDFPWLKEGVVFKGDDDYLDEHELTFSPCSYLDEAPRTSPPSFNQSCSLNLCVSPTLDASFHETKFDDDGFWSLLLDHPEPGVHDPEPADCIWNCVIDQPLDMGFNKGL